MSSSTSNNQTSSDPLTVATNYHPDDAAVAEKRQPWKAVWPAPRESQPQAQIYGFRKGEVMVFDGNAGNFFVRDGWNVEQESDQQK